MYSLNRIHVLGYQTQPVEVRTTPSGASVTDLNLVVPYTFTSNEGETLTGKSFFTVTVWGRMAETAGQFIKPGGQVFIAGRLQTDSWDDNESGEKRNKTKVVALDMLMTDPKDGQMPAPSGAKLITDMCNRAEVIGNLGQDPEMRTTPNGKNVITFSVATNERWKDKNSGEMQERNEWHRVVAWDGLADEINQHIRRGNRVYVSGRLQTRAWETPDGKKRTTTEIIAEQVTLLGTKNEAAAGNIAASAAPVATATPAPPANDAPLPTEQAAPATVPVPEVNYPVSEIKASDLPF